MVGRKIVNANLLANLGFNYEANLIDIGSSVLYGKIKNDNTYLAYGGILKIVNFNGNMTDNLNYVMVGPSIQKGKFIELVDKFYLAPYLGGSAALMVGGDEYGVNVQAEAVPLRFVYDFSNHFMLNASFGSAYLSFQNFRYNTNITLSGSLTNNSSFGVFYTFK